MSKTEVVALQAGTLPHGWRQVVLEAVPVAEAARIERFKHEADARRAAALNVLLRSEAAAAAAAAATGTGAALPCRWQDVVLARTKEGKPMVVAPQMPKGFNANGSHHGDWAVAVAGCEGLVGIDVMVVELTGLRRDIDNPAHLEEFFANLRYCFTGPEWAQIRARGTPREQLRDFYIKWTLKEAYIKAVGIGLGLDLETIEFDTQDLNQISMRIKGRRADAWQFVVGEIDAQHVLAVARGPYSESLDEFRASVPGAAAAGENVGSAVERLGPIEVAVRDGGELLGLHV